MILLMIVSVIEGESLFRIEEPLDYVCAIFTIILSVIGFFLFEFWALLLIVVHHLFSKVGRALWRSSWEANQTLQKRIEDSAALGGYCGLIIVPLTQICTAVVYGVCKLISWGYRKLAHC